MPPSDPLRQQMIDCFDTMPGQLQQAARYLLEHPDDVALVSMREMARHAAVQPATMTRLAKFLGLKGYDDLRAHYADALRRGGDGFATKIRQRPTSEASSENESAYQMLQGISAQIAQLSQPDTLHQLSEIAAKLASARHVFVLGLRSCHTIAWHFHYVMSLLGERSVHLDGPGGTGGDALMRAQPGDVVLAVSVKPYAVETLTLANLANDQGLEVVSITDSEVSPLVALSQQVIFCPTESPSFFHTLTPALAISEVLCALLAERDRPKALEALQRADEYHLQLKTYSIAPPKRE